MRVEHTYIIGRAKNSSSLWPRRELKEIVVYCNKAAVDITCKFLIILLELCIGLFMMVVDMDQADTSYLRLKHSNGSIT